MAYTDLVDQYKGGSALFSQFWHLTLHYMLMHRRIFVSGLEETGYAAGDGGPGEDRFLRVARRRVAVSMQDSTTLVTGGAGSCVVCFVCGSGEHLASKHRGSPVTVVTDAIKLKVRAVVAAKRCSEAKKASVLARGAAFWAAGT